MRVKAVKMDEYRADRGLQLDVNTSSIWQFLVSEGGSVFLAWLTPTKEYVKPKVENKRNFFDLANLLSKGEENKEEVTEFKVNPSVCAIGVSFAEFQSEKDKWLSYGVPVFVSVDLSSQILGSVKSWLKATALDSQVTYVLDLGLKYKEVQDLVTTLKEQNISENQVRLVGGCVFKYKGQNYCGLFSPSFAKAYKLEYIYDSEPHKATQVFLSKDSAKTVPLNECIYPKVDYLGGI